MKSIKLTSLIAFSLVTMLFVSCSDSTNNGSGEIAPVIPSAESMTIDISEFNDNAKSNAGSNFNNAVFRSGIAKLIIDANLFIPKVLINAAQDNNPELVAEGEYQWRYSAENGEDDFSVLLTAEVDAEDDVEWNFFVTTSATNPPLNNFLFFSGEAEYDGTEGSWRYFDSQTDGAVSEITWDIDNDGSVELDFSVLSDRNGNEGSEIEYDFDGTIKTLVYVDGSSEDITTIQFNTETNVGFIISPNYNEGVKSCWDESLNDVPCSN